MLWKFRPLIVFSSPGGEKLSRAQQALFEEMESQVADRDMKLLVVRQEDHPWRKRFSIQEKDFEVVLVGKDGGVKMRSNQPLTPAEVFQEIDRMPMRRREMRESE
jgi:hypothetical protein